MSPVLAVRDLSVEFAVGPGQLRAVRELSYEVSSGETLAICGESGSGKSVSAAAVMRLLPGPPAVRVSGEVLLDGDDLLRLPMWEHRRRNGASIAMIYQDALAALNPVYTVGWQIAELFRSHRAMSRRDANRAAIELIDRVRIPDARARAKSYPHELSGGMRQRILIAMAIALEPRVIIADEPTTALDVTIQAQILELLQELQRESSMALVLITHDLGVVAEVADRVLVMYGGQAMEQAAADDFFAEAAHPYSRALLAAMPSTDEKTERLQTLPSGGPQLYGELVGCQFQRRCASAVPTCALSVPEIVPLGRDRFSRCHLAGGVAVADDGQPRPADRASGAR
jgi:oligopeptide transport system ATP-binding protein